jgi:beta-fructofuranosidase
MELLMQWNLWILALTSALVSSHGAEMPVITNPAVAKAMASLEQGTLRAQADPARPIYHFHPPAFWMNDPNGPVYHQGYYHLFYQLNPYGDTWGHMHWGHARSRDLVHWQPLPIALWPSDERGEEQVFSGCCVINPKGQPMIFYTSIARNKPAETFAEQWAALGDKNLVVWQKYPGNPVLSEELHGKTKVYDWRDPFIFQEKGAYYMVLGGNLNQRKGGQAIVNLYRAENDQLTRWRYLGVLFTHPDPKVPNIECPNFFKLGDRWVLIVSPHGPVEYFVGDFDLKTFKFNARFRSLVDRGGNFYAPNSLLDHHGRRIMWGWINGFKPDHGWNGCLTVPRVLSLGANDELLQKPAPELKKLRTDHFRLADFRLENTTRELSGPKGDCLEIYADIELLDATAFELLLRRSADGTRSIPIRFSGTELEIAGSKAAFTLLPAEKTLKLDVLLDKSVVEVFANNRACFSRVIDPGTNDLAVAVSASGGTARIRSFHSWTMRTIF